MRTTVVLTLVLAFLAAGCETVESLTTEGNTAAAWQKYDHAFKKYDAALAKDPGHLPAMLGKAKALEGAKKFAEAEAAYNEVLAKKPGHKETIERLAGMFTERGKNVYKEKKFADAAKWYEKVTGLPVPEQVKKSAREHARECRFQGFFTGITPRLEKLDGYDKKQKLFSTSGEAKKPKRGNAEDTQRAALEAAHAALNAQAHKLSSKAKDAKARPAEPVAAAVPTSGEWTTPKKVFTVTLAIPAEKLARLIFDINEGK